MVFGPGDFGLRRILIGKNSGEFRVRYSCATVRGTLVHPKMLEPRSSTLGQKSKPLNDQIAFTVTPSTGRPCVFSFARRFSRARRFLFSFCSFCSRWAHGTRTHRGAFSAPFTITRSGNTEPDATPASGKRKRS